MIRMRAGKACALAMLLASACASTPAHETTVQAPVVAAAPEPLPATLPSAESPAAVREAMLSRGPAVRQCYTRELRNTPSLHGRMLVEFTVDPDGAIGRVKIRRDTIGSPRVRACVTQVIAGLRFAARSAAPVHFRYPFVFAPD
jgi:outer membrane biosynthesis protein TonB